MKSITVTAKKVKEGDLVSLSDEFHAMKGNKFIVENIKGDQCSLRLLCDGNPTNLVLSKIDVELLELQSANNTSKPTRGSKS